MKLRIVKYVHGKDRGCKSDDVWYIERIDTDDNNKVFITCWPENSNAPYSVEGFDPRMVYYSEALSHKILKSLDSGFKLAKRFTVSLE